uniref:Uncharacterized protein LOC114347181 n=1 Tax=Diabrotica virgifera virgifera TaxID=50390 RepID=A0A6P7H7M8_DIAVI
MASTCTHCNDNFIVNTKRIKCKLCENLYHYHCVTVKDAVIKAVNDSPNVFWFCDVCVISLEERIKIISYIKSVETKTESLIEDTKRVMEAVKVDSDQKKKASYSAVVSRGQSSLIIKPKINQTSKETKNEVAQKIKPADISVAVSKIKPVSQGSLLIEC